MADHDFSLLARESLRSFWTDWGFEAWNSPPFAGVCRRQRFVKHGFLGKVAEFSAWDCIVWSSSTKEARERLWQSLAPLPDVFPIMRTDGKRCAKNAARQGFVSCSAFRR